MNGGKHYLAKRIVAAMPPRCKNPNKPADDDAGYLHYCEPYFGAGSVLFANDSEGIAEVVNDIDEHLTNFWSVLQHPERFEKLRWLCEATPFSETEYRKARAQLHDLSDDPVLAAWNFFVSNRQSRQGLEKCFATLTRNRTRRGMSEQASAWLSAIEGLPEFHARLKCVVILNDDATQVIRQQDGPRTLFYCDPPYLHETRSTDGREYTHEMNDDDHEGLLTTLAIIKGRFILSGYHSRMYDEAAAEYKWRCVEIDNKASGAKSKEKKIECLWMNYE